QGCITGKHEDVPPVCRDDIGQSAKVGTEDMRKLLDCGGPLGCELFGQFSKSSNVDQQYAAFAKLVPWFKRSLAPGNKRRKLSVREISRESIVRKGQRASRHIREAREA